MSNGELAEWFNVKENTIAKKKTDYMKKLEDYCVFEKCRGGICVKEIIGQDTYDKNKNFRLVKDNFDAVWAESGLDTCRRVGEALYVKFEDEFTVQSSSVYEYTKNVRNQLYGSPIDGTFGEKGRSYYVYCKRVGDHYEFLSEEEEQIKKELLKEYFSDADEKTIIVQSMIDRGEIKKEDAWGKYQDLINLPHNYAAFLEEFKRRTGILLIKGTLIERNF